MKVMLKYFFLTIFNHNHAIVNLVEKNIFFSKTKGN